jgi:hypothetical protein
MNEREMTANETQEFGADVVTEDGGATPELEEASNPVESVTGDEPRTLASGVEPGSRPRRPSTRSTSAAARRRGAEFDPTSRGDENGEVM